MLADAHAGDAKFVLLSDNLPVDATRFQEADAIVYCYLFAGFGVDPIARTSGSEKVGAFNADDPAALCAIFGDGDINDEGGVHTNSSLLNYLAWMLYEKGGMTPGEGRAFWFTVDCAMVPGTDYPQLREILPWSLKAAGLERLETELQRALDATRLGQNDVPDTFDEDRALLTLKLPDNEVFKDEQWVMTLVSVNVDKAIESAQQIILSVQAGDYSVLPPTVQGILEANEAQPEETDTAEDASLLEVFLDALTSGEPDEADAEALAEAELKEVDVDADAATSDLKAELIEWCQTYFRNVFYQGNTNAGQDGHTMRIVTIPGYSVPVLMHAVFDESTSSVNDLYLVVYIGNQWIDLGSLGNVMTAEDGESGETSDEIYPQIDKIIQQIGDGFGNIHSLDDALSLFFYHVEGGKQNELPADGLEDVQPQSMDEFSGSLEEDTEIQPRMSRPKPEEEQQAA